MADKYNGKYPKAWSDDDIQTYLDSGQEPKKASNGVWVTDVTRDERDLVDWTVAELFALYNGEISSVNSAGDDAFIAAVRVKARLSNNEAGKWSDDELYTWLMTDKAPEKTKSGNYRNDPERFTKDVHLLNDSELVDFGLGEFGPYERSREYVLVEALDRFNLPLGTTFEDYAHWCATKEKPKLAPHGSLINDRIRDAKLIGEWTEDELKDWAVGAIGEGSLTVAELLIAAIKTVSGEWYWSKADLGSYIDTGVLPLEDTIDLSAFHPAELLQFFRETHVEAAYDQWKKLCVVEKLTPAQVKAAAPVDKIPDAWDDLAIYTYADKNTLPVAYTDTTWYNDVTRDARVPGNLTTEEIEGCWHGKLHFTEEQQAAIVARAAEDLRVHGDEKYQDLYDEDALWLYFDDIEPLVFEGLLVRSKTRDELPVEEWSDTEVRALFNEVIETKQVIDLDALVIARTPQWEGLGTVKERKQWFIDETGPACTENGVLVEDPKRCLTSINNWTDAELIALAHGWIDGLKNVSEEALLSVLAERKLIGSSDWSLSEAVQFFTDGTEPEKTEFGSDVVKYDDQTINRKSDLKFFSDWATGKVTLPNSQAEVLNRVRAIIGANTASDEEIMALLNDFKGDGSDGFKELPLHEQLKDGTEESRVKVLALWNLPADTSVEDALAAWEKMDKTTLARNDVLLSDPRRDIKAAMYWTLEELRAWARGEIGSGTASDMPSLCKAIRKRISAIGEGWDDKSVKAFAATGALPQMTSTGVLVVDIVRDRKWPSDWSDADLKAWAGGEIKTPIQVTADIMLTLRVRFKVPQTYNNQQMIQFVLTGETPPVEPEKPFTNAVAATDNQIKAFLKGEFELPADVAEVAFKEARARFKVDVHWTDKAIMAFYTDGTPPAKTSSGLFVEDRLRNLTTSVAWSYKEVEALAKGEIKAPLVPVKSAAYLDKARVMIKVEKGLPADKWSTDEVLTYLREGTAPTILVGNVFANDPKRLEKAALSWNNDELRAWLRNEIPATEKAPEADLWDVVYTRFQVTNAWYPADARSYVLTGAVVPSTPSGIWIRDRERDQRSAWTWTRAEVKAWARGQILPGLNAPEKDLLQQATICFNLSASLSPEYLKERVAAITEDTTPMTVTFVRDDLLAFAAGMKKEGADEVKAAAYQQLLNRCIIRVCNLRGQDFVDGWSELLKFYFNQKGTLLTAKNLYNGVAMMTITTKQQQNFQYMTTILFNTCDPATREAAVKRIQWVVSLAGLPNDEARHQVLAFYGLS